VKHSTPECAVCQEAVQNVRAFCAKASAERGFYADFHV
jgi:hypothetical protein